jgi:hypothetical protein
MEGVCDLICSSQVECVDPQDECSTQKNTNFPTMLGVSEAAEEPLCSILNPEASGFTAA